jgi:hypothetical protein
VATRTITRRRLLVALGSAALSVPVLGVLSFRNSRYTAVVAAIVHTRLSYLRCDPAGVNAFAADFVARLSPSGRKRLWLTAALYPLYPTLLSPSGPLMDRSLKQWEEALITSFLLGSDLFRAGGGETKTVRYVGYYDPYSMICGNPFARFD